MPCAVARSTHAAGRGNRAGDRISRRSANGLSRSFTVKDILGLERDPPPAPCTQLRVRLACRFAALAVAIALDHRPAPAARVMHGRSHLAARNAAANLSSMTPWSVATSVVEGGRERERVNGRMYGHCCSSAAAQLADPQGRV